MRIVHVVESLDRGGLERMVADLALAQRAGGHDVAVICLFHRGTLAAEVAAAAIPVSEIGKRSGLDLAALWRLWRALRRLQPQILHTHNATSHYHCALVCRATRSGVLVNTRHGMGDEPGSRVERRYRGSLTHTARVVAVSEYSGRYLVERGIVPAGLLGVIPNGIRIERFAQRTRSDARGRLGIADETLLVGSVGRLNPVKDQHVLVAAIAALAPRFPTLRAVVIGDGALRAELQQQIAQLRMEQRICLLGDRSDVPELLPALDVFALPSRTEGYSIALLEAAATGLPMVVTDVGGNREIVHDGVTGLIAGQDFTATLAGLLADREQRARLGAAARRWALEHASVEAMARRYDNLYRSVL